MILKRIYLTENNYAQLQQELNRVDSDFYISAANFYYCWVLYGFKISYIATDNAIYIYAQKEDVDQTLLIRPIIKKGENILIHFKKMLFIGLQFIKFKSSIKWVRILENDLPLFNEYKIINELDSAYFYPTDQLKYMAGKKMQKRRNFLNFFTKNYSSKTKIIKYKDLYYDDVIKFCTKHIKESNPDVFRNSELNSIKGFLKSKSDNGYGSIMFYEGKIIGVTFGFITGDKYEIFLEKADKSFKGSYQYLLSNNLKLNNINTKIIDRQDSESDQGLIISKKSYKPSKIIHTYLIETKI